MPIEFNEPLSFNQRLCEYMEYSELLDKANTSLDPVKRMEYVSAFAVSALAGNSDRIYKPFNPLLGETYEMERKDMGFRFVVEQVSHHPPISAFHAESKNYMFNGFIQPKLKFWGKSLEIKPEGLFTLVLKALGDTYTWRNVTCFVHNIIMGKLWFDQSGLMEITESSSGLKAVLDFKASHNSSNKDRHIEGYIINEKREKLKYFFGKWTEHLKSFTPDEVSNVAKHRRPSKLSLLTRTLTGGGPSTSDSFDSSTNNHGVDGSNEDVTVNSPDGGELLWKIQPKQSNCHEFYNFSLFTITLNDLLPGMVDELPTTDSRFRPDIRLYEQGDFERARKEKLRLEEKQRENRNVKSQRNNKVKWKPMWFREDPEKEWVFTNEYWQRDFTQCPNIF